MSYVKTTWANGDTITAAGLNNIENQVEANDTAATAATAGIPVRVPFTLTAGEGGIVATTSASFSETMAAFASGKTIIADAVLTGGTTETHLVGIMSGNVDATTPANNMLYGSIPYYDGDHQAHVLATIAWSSAGAAADQVTLTTT